MTVALAAFPQFLDNAGALLSGGKLYTYAAGTTTPLASYTDQDGTTPNANPVILDSAGRADVWLTANVPYKLVLKTSADVTLETVDEFYAGANPEQLAAAGIVPATGGTYTGAVHFTGGVTFDGTPAQDFNTLDSLGIASAQNANLWMNSEFRVWQRNTASVADGAYGFDRTVNLASTGSVTVSSVSDTPNTANTAMRMTQPDASAKRIGALQIVEGVNAAAYRGHQVVFSARLRCSAAATVRMAIVAWTSTLDAPPRDIVNNWSSTNYTASNFFVANTTTIATAGTALAANTWTDVYVSSTSAGGVSVPSGMNNLIALFWSESTLAQNVTLDVTGICLGLGVSPPLWTPPDYGRTLDQCFRYFKKSVRQSYNGYQTAGGGVGGAFSQPGAPMRASPTVTGVVVTSNVNVTSPTLTGLTGITAYLAGAATGTGAFLIDMTGDLDAEIGT